MDPVAKKNPALVIFIVSLIVFNVLFFARDFLMVQFFKLFDVYSQCPEDSLICDPGSYTYVDDVIIGLFALSMFAAAVSASILINNQIGKSWQKRQGRRKTR